MFTVKIDFLKFSQSHTGIGTGTGTSTSTVALIKGEAPDYIKGGLPVAGIYR